MTELGNLLWMPNPSAEPRATPAQPLDHQARKRALDVTNSWIVQAPAGAGKTELLTQRFLTLLNVVDEPEEILAITFTRAATAEMRGRILSALEEAALEKASPTKDEPQTLTLARAALHRSRQRGWQLLEQPHRLDVQTIDSLCLRLAHNQPLLARLGGRLDPTEQAAALYGLAAKRTFAQLGRGAAELNAAISQLLRLRDNNLDDCQALIAGMLECREQWRHVFVLGEQAAVDWDRVRTRLEAPFRDEVQRVLGALHQALSSHPTLVAELLELARYACSNGNPAPIALLDGLRSLPAPDAPFAEHWGCLRNFLLTRDGSWRRSVTMREGFPSKGDGMSRAERSRYKQRMTGLIEDLRRDEPAAEQLRALLCRIPALPAARYEESQWQTLLSVFRVLRQAVAELHVVFAERNQVDFPELSIAAATVLDDQENTRGLLASEAKHHLLIDEFQDTSRRQHQLIGHLLREWQPGDGRTCFLVGDPMQSIYIFRQAEVELFGRVQRRGLDCGGHAHPCAELRLSENFRSHRGLVDPLNQYFAAIFAGDTRRGEVPFAPSTAAAPAPEGLEAVQVHASFCSSRDPESGPRARRAQVDRVVALVEEELPRIRAAAQPGSGQKTYRVAILGRARNHLAPIAAALRARDIAFRAVELETLAERQEILDLRSLLQALLHPMDRIAWLSVLRAPWCGLALRDLHTLVGADDRNFRSTPVPALIVERAHLLTPDGQERLARTAAVMARAATETVQSLAEWVERAWTSLGAPAYLVPEERANAESFFRLLDELPPNGIAVFDGSLDTALGRLCAAPDAGVSEDFGVQLMTIHKAKGLGFEVVIVPALERMPGGDGSPLVTMLERVRPGPATGEEPEDEVLVAPLGQRGKQHRTYKWVQAERRQREAGERKRLFYVACTRARRQLHLLGTAELGADAQLKPGASESLLACAWPALAPLFAAAQREQGMAIPLPSPMIAEPPAAAEPGYLPSLAAAGAPPADALSLWRVPSGFAPQVSAENVTSTYARRGAAVNPAEPNFTRPEGSFEQRARGNAVHAMLELVSERWAREGRAGEPPVLREQLDRLARNTLRGAGLAPAKVDALTPALVATVLAAASDPEGRWILSPHPGAQSEWSVSGFTGVENNSAGKPESRLRTLRVDRVFRAGEAPLSAGNNCLWVIDYKTGAAPGGVALDAYLEGQKEQWQPQLAAYGAALRALHGEKTALRFGLYFPELQRLKSWSD